MSDHIVMKVSQRKSAAKRHQLRAPSPAIDDALGENAMNSLQNFTAKKDGLPGRAEWDYPGRSDIDTSDEPLGQSDDYAIAPWMRNHPAKETDI